ncbi:legumain-like [Octopus vulgaris]|uniref:Hemoglobinase n=1 Tax=Octopus vulgaris TaxID=6645 RepID=A0AA36BTU4_OCTVU|nr:legumain-like [Octopus vulgaris]
MLATRTHFYSNPSWNPEPGKVINKPNGVNVYEGVPKDYTGDDVTPSVFLNVLQGKKEALNGHGSGKVIASGPQDNVFVYFADHGAPGIVAFPSEYLHASQLHTAIMNMHEQKKYNKMVLYIEACESGSMFPGLPKDIKVFATTAANDHESSYACYYDDKLDTFLGDVYSVCWMENSDKASLSSESLQQQFQIVKKETNTSHVQEFGDMSMKNLKLSAFQGNQRSNNGLVITEEDVEKTVPRFDLSNSVDAHETTMYILRRRLQKAETKEEQEAITAELQDEYLIREIIEDTLQNIVRNATTDQELINRVNEAKNPSLSTACYDEAIDHLHYTCVEFQNSFRIGEVAKCEFPSAVFIKFTDMKYNHKECGGVVLDSKRVATAAHCVLPDLQKVELRTGIVNSGKRGIALSWRRVISMPANKKGEDINDLAIITLVRPIHFYNCYKGIELAKPDESFVDRTCMSIGWGKHNTKLLSPHVL